MNSFRCIAAVVLATIGVACDGGTTQWDVTGMCDTCEIRLEQLWATDRADPNVGYPMSAVEVGDSLLVLDNLSNRLVLFGPAGRTVRMAGRRGDGPGEFNGELYSVHRFGDGSFAVLGERRVTFLSPELEFTDAIETPMVVRGPAASVGDSALVVAGFWKDQSTDLLQHRISRSGELALSYDSTTLALGEDAIAVVAPGADLSVWITLLTGPFQEARFRLQQWDPGSGRLLRSVGRQPAWFEAFEPVRNPGTFQEGAGDSAPSVYAAFQDSSQVLWTLTIVSDPDRDPSQPASPGDLADIILEAIDVETSESIAGYYLEEYVAGFTPDGRLIMYEEDDNGIPQISLWSVDLVGR